MVVKTKISILKAIIKSIILIINKNFNESEQSRITKDQRYKINSKVKVMKSSRKSSRRNVS